MRKQCLFLIFLGVFLFSIPTNAQSFKSAVGLRLGYPLSISFKQFISESEAIELTAGTRGFNRILLNSRYRWYSVSGAYQVHQPIEDVEGLFYYYGGGASAYFWTFSFDTDSSNISLGLQGYLGLSYTVNSSPVNISIDWVPTIFIKGFSGSGFGGGYGGIAVRYILNNE